MNPKKIILIISAVFYIIILGLSFSAKIIHTASLPRVKVINLDFEEFDVVETEDESGIDNDINDNETDLIIKKYDFQLGIPKYIYDNKKVFILFTKIINGEERSIAKEVTNLELGRTNESCYEVIQGITSMDQVIIEGQDMLQDGCEVYVEE